MNAPLNAVVTEARGAAKGSALLKVDNLSLSYHSSRGSTEALRQLSFELGEGEFVSLLGPSGCGKSTVLKIVSGLLKPTSGSVILAGKPVTGPRPDVGIVFQQPTLLPWKTVLQNVLVPVRTLRLPMSKFRKRAEELLDLVGLAKFADHYPYELSGGMQQRVGIARGLVADPTVLLMDEPFAALDAMSREFMMQELQRIWMAAGKSVIFITHSIQEAVFLSDRVLTLSSRPGRIVDELAIDLPRPRSLSDMSKDRAAQYSDHIRALFGETGKLK